jgi:hypothetical protein
MSVCAWEKKTLNLKTLPRQKGKLGQGEVRFATLKTSLRSSIKLGGWLVVQTMEHNFQDDRRSWKRKQLYVGSRRAVSWTRYAGRTLW